MFCAAPVLSAAWAGMTDSLCRFYHGDRTYSRLYKTLSKGFVAILRRISLLKTLRHQILEMGRIGEYWLEFFLLFFLFVCLPPPSAFSFIILVTFTQEKWHVMVKACSLHKD